MPEVRPDGGDPPKLIVKCPRCGTGNRLAIPSHGRIQCGRCAVPLIEALCEGLQDSDDQERADVARLLAVLENDASVGPLAVALSDPVEDVRTWAFGALLLFVKPKHSPELLAVETTDAGEPLRWQLLQQLGDEAYQEVFAVLSEAAESGARLRALQHLKDAGAATLLEAARVARSDRSPRVRGAAVEALGQLRDNRRWAALAPYLDDDDSDIRIAAAQALVYSDDPYVARLLATRLEREDDYEVIRALGWMLRTQRDVSAYEACDRLWDRADRADVADLMEVVGESLDKVLARREAAGLEEVGFRRQDDRRRRLKAQLLEVVHDLDQKLQSLVVETAELQATFSVLIDHDVRSSEEDIEGPGGPRDRVHFLSEEASRVEEAVTGVHRELERLSLLRLDYRESLAADEEREEFLLSRAERGYDLDVDSSVVRAREAIGAARDWSLDQLEAME